MNLQPFIQAFQSHQWVIFGALVVGALVAFSKQGWLSAWLAKKITPAMTPYYAILVSVLTVGSGDLSSGKSWQQAIQDALSAVMVAIVGHELVIEGFRKGRELVPERAPEEKK